MALCVLSRVLWLSDSYVRNMPRVKNATCIPFGVCCVLSIWIIFAFYYSIDLRRFSTAYFRSLLQDELQKTLSTLQIKTFEKKHQSNKTLQPSKIACPNSVFTNAVSLFPSEGRQSIPQPQHILGNGKDFKVQFAIGVPTIQRPLGVTYLSQTLQSLFHNLYPINENDVAITVFIADSEGEQYVKSLMESLYQNFTREIETGLLQIISRPKDFSPPENLPLTLGDPIERVQWRSKEVFDAAYLMLYCQDKADFYIMLEDDVVAARGYIAAAKRFVKNYKANYIYSSLAHFSSIGKLFPTPLLGKWSSYLFTFYADKPIDWLMSDYLRLQSCTPDMKDNECAFEIRKNSPSLPLTRGLFQHIGVQSSLLGKTQKLRDDKFKTVAIANPHVNPGADVQCSYVSVDESTADDLYSSNGLTKKYFFIKESLQGDHITVTFSDVEFVRRILIKTGNSHGKYRFCYNCATIAIETHEQVDSNNNTATLVCTNFDRNGQAECFPNQPIIRFHVVNTRDISNYVYFHVIFVLR